MDLSLASIPGIEPEQELVVREAAKATGLAVGASIVAALFGRLVGTGAARTFYGLGLVAYAMLRARDNPVLAGGLATVGAESLAHVLLAAVWQRVAPAGALSGSVGRAPLPYRSVAGWN